MFGSGLRDWFGLRKRRTTSTEVPPASQPSTSSTPAVASRPDDAANDWPFFRIEVNNALWGPGYLFPGGEIETLRMAKPMQLSGETSVLLLGAGAGGPARSLCVKFGSWVTALEENPELAVAAMEFALKANLGKRVQVEQWSPKEPELRKRYYNHCLAFEPMRGAQPEPLLTALGGALKSGGHLAMVELVADAPLDPSDQTVAKWARLEHRPDGARLRRRDPGRERRRGRLRTDAQRLEHARVPEAVEVGGAQPAQRDAHAVAAAVLVVGGVQRLVHVAHEVEQVLERQQPLGGARWPARPARRRTPRSCRPRSPAPGLGWPARPRPAGRSRRRSGPGGRARDRRSATAPSRGARRRARRPPRWRARACRGR